MTRMNVPRRVVVETEFPIVQLNFPAQIDHAWLGVAAGIHRRLFELTPDDSIVPGLIESIIEQGENRYLLHIDSRHTWADGKKVNSREIAAIFLRPIVSHLFETVSVLDPEHIIVTTQVSVRLNALLLASPVFTLTPCCRSDITEDRTATCGQYQITWASEDRRVMRFSKRHDAFDIDQHSPDEIVLLATRSRAEGIQLLKAGAISVTCTLGADPNSYPSLSSVSTAGNRLTNLAMVLHPYSSSVLNHDEASRQVLAGAVDRRMLAAASSNTLIPFETPHTEGRRSLSESDSSLTNGVPWSAHRYRGPRELNIRFVDFHPNREIATDLANQLRSNLGVRCELYEVTYGSYVSGIYDDRPGISLEIVQPLLYVGDEPRVSTTQTGMMFRPAATRTEVIRTSLPIELPLLQNRTTLLSLDNRYCGRQLMNAEAHLIWKFL